MKISNLLFFILSTWFFACQTAPPDTYTYQPPAQLNDGLAVGTLAGAGIDSVLIGQAAESILQDRYREVHSLLIFRGGKLVFEEYFKGHQFQYDTTLHHGELVKWERDMPHPVMSVTKSVTSICVGIAIDKGFIKSQQQSIFDYLPEHQQFRADGKEKITIEHLLTMTSGLEGNEWLVPYSNLKNDVLTIYLSEDPVTHILSKPLKHEPGRFFQYYGGSNFLLAEIIKNATQMDLEAFSAEHLFGPLGVTSQSWSRIGKNVVDGAGGLTMTPRDMVKIGVTFLNGGAWNGQQIVSKNWVGKSANPYPGNRWLNDWDDHSGMKGYAYSWWAHSFVHEGEKIDMFYAAGWGGQYIMVLPAFDVVVVFTGGNYADRRPCFDILKKYVVKALG